MLLTLLFLLVLLSGIFMFLPIFKDNFKVYWHKKTLADKSDFCLVFGIINSVIGTIGLIFCLCFILGNQINKNLTYEERIYEKYILEYRLEHKNEDIVGNEMLYNDIVKFNNSLRFSKKYKDSLWLNWFINEQVANIDYIEVEINEKEN